jgi:hypothetical protein
MRIEAMKLIAGKVTNLPKSISIGGIQPVGNFILRVFALMFACLPPLCGSGRSLHGQNDAWSVPLRSPDRFAFPYPPPLPDEPGVTLARRYMLDGEPELSFRLRDGDELWLISSREIRELPADAAALSCRRAVADGWKASSLNDFLNQVRQQPGTQTVVYVHGDRTDEFWARRRGKQVYQATTGNRPAIPPTRFVIWAWPSEQPNKCFRRPVMDFSKSLDRSRIDGFSLGFFLSHLPDETDPLLVAYSLGSQVTLTALAELAASGCQRSYRMLSIVPVIHCHWSTSETDLLLATSMLRSLHLVRNERDVAIRAYRIFCRIQCPERVKSEIDVLVDRFAMTEQIDVSREEGREHNITGYIGVPSVIEEFDKLVFESPSPVGIAR